MVHKVSIADELLNEEGKRSTGQMPEDMPRWMARAVRTIDLVSHGFGYLVCFMTIPLLAVMATEIFMRYTFASPTVWAYDLSRMLYGAMFMLGAGYALLRGVHIRADFLYRDWSPRTQAVVDLVLYLTCYFPGLIVFLWFAYDFAFSAWMRAERGMDTAWMPALGPVKTALPVGVAMLLVQGVSEVLKCVYAISKNRWP